MVLLLSQDDLAGIINVRDCMKYMEQCLRNLATGEAWAQPHVRMLTPIDAGRIYWSNIMSGGDKTLGVFALRVDSTIVENLRVDGMDRQPFTGKRSTGTIQLYDLGTGDLLCVFPDFDISGVRVGATVGVGAKYLARSDAHTVGLLGTGKIARASLEAVAAVRQLTSVKVYSPNSEHREDFVRSMEALLDVPIQAVGSSEEAVVDSDIVVAASNTNEPVLSGDWLAPGAHVTSIMMGFVPYRADGPPLPSRMELDLETFRRANRVFQTSVKNADIPVTGDISESVRLAPTDLGEAIKQGAVREDELVGLDEIIAGSKLGRTSGQEITVLRAGSNGVQFPAVGAWLYQAARDKDLGEKVSDRYFSTDTRQWTDKGYFPSA